MITINEYFDGQVKSMAINSGVLPATIGVMLAGDYTFGTDKREVMTVVQGELIVKLPGENIKQTFKNGQVFEVPANSKFDVTVVIDTAYLCQYCE
ncbi:pyrimidine/purine nucleoside phosphorylase [Marinagarivorans algicola]|uniref:pyrimidine/purine nucleoside phosphorylase n=1 Tax=Marinagarivorans algicola TaxID=1513270 RepID=UPI0006B3FEE8|nr:pyrimidine/purine nucleoside phosphorylase [Marinagarivorans algicola]